MTEELKDPRPEIDEGEILLYLLFYMADDKLMWCSSHPAVIRHIRKRKEILDKEHLSRIIDSIKTLIKRFPGWSVYTTPGEKMAERWEELKLELEEELKSRNLR